MLFAGQQIPKSPFDVYVDKALGDASKVTVKGPGVEAVGNIANKPTHFDICTAGQGPAEHLAELRGWGWWSARLNLNGFPESITPNQRRQEVTGFYCSFSARLPIGCNVAIHFFW